MKPLSHEGLAMSPSQQEGPVEGLNGDAIDAGSVAMCVNVDDGLFISVRARFALPRNQEPTLVVGVFPCPAQRRHRTRIDTMAQDPVAQVKKLFYRRLRVCHAWGARTSKPWADTTFVCVIGPSEGWKDSNGRFPVI